MLIYDFPDAYDLFYPTGYQEAAREFFRSLFAGQEIRQVLDCSVGSGLLSLPLARMGCTITGTDVNQQMLRQARKNFAAEGLPVVLQQADFTNLTRKINRRFNLVMCSGNSLAHVKPEVIPVVLREMDALVEPGGLLYIDSRNWDLIIPRQQRFYLYNPVIRDRGRVNLLEVWDYHKDGSLTANYLVSEEVENRIVSKRQFYTIHWPFPYHVITQTLAELGYGDLFSCKMGDTGVVNLNEADWYALTAIKKGKNSKKSIFKKKSK